MKRKEWALVSSFFRLTFSLSLSLSRLLFYLSPRKSVLHEVSPSDTHTPRNASPRREGDTHVPGEGDTHRRRGPGDAASQRRPRVAHTALRGGETGGYIRGGDGVRGAVPREVSRHTRPIRSHRGRAPGTHAPRVRAHRAGFAGRGAVDVPLHGAIDRDGVVHRHRRDRPPDDVLPGPVRPREAIPRPVRQRELRQGGRPPRHRHPDSRDERRIGALDEQLPAAAVEQAIADRRRAIEPDTAAPGVFDGVPGGEAGTGGEGKAREGGGAEGEEEEGGGEGEAEGRGLAVGTRGQHEEQRHDRHGARGEAGWFGGAHAGGGGVDEQRGRGRQGIR